MVLYNPSAQHRLGQLPKVANGRLNPGFLGNVQTVNLMRKMAHYRKGHPLVRRLAEEIIYDYQVDSHNYLDEAIAIGDFVKDNCRYVKDPTGIEMLQDPVLMIQRLMEGKCTGDCDDQALLAVTLMLAVGLDPYLKIIRYPGYEKGFQHIYVYVEAKNHRQAKEQVAIDPILKDKPIGYELPHVESKLFLV